MYIILKNSNGQMVFGFSDKTVFNCFVDLLCSLSSCSSDVELISVQLKKEKK